jgi:phosphatidylglycerophosphate synthase
VLWETNALLARPVAAFFGSFDVAPGQLSLQSLTVSLVGLLRMASGDWGHVVQGALIVYGGLLLDRADHLMARKKGGLRSWGIFLGLIADRLVEAGLVIGLAVLAATGTHGQPSGLQPWEFVPTPWVLVLALGALAAMLCTRLVAAYSDLLALRSHLLTSRRLPGPSTLAGPTGAERLGRIFDRDLLVLAWLVGTVLLQVQLTLVVLLLVHLLALGEAVALAWQRRRDPEPRASRVLSPDYP